jgi:hypothetical protein
MPTDKKTNPEVIRFAKNAMKYHMEYLKDHIFNEIEQNEKLSMEYLDLLDDRCTGKKQSARDKIIDELREEIWLAITNVFMVNGLLHDWPDYKNVYLIH